MEVAGKSKEEDSKPQMSLSERIGSKLLGTSKLPIHELFQAEHEGMLTITKDQLWVGDTYVKGDTSPFNLFRGTLMNLPGGVTEADARKAFNARNGSASNEVDESHHVLPPEIFGRENLTPEHKDQIIKIRKVVAGGSVEMRLEMLNNYHNSTGRKLSEKAFANSIWLTMPDNIAESIFDLAKGGWNSAQLYRHICLEHGRKKSNAQVKEEVDRLIDNHNNGSIEDLVSSIMVVLTLNSTSAKETLDHALSELRRFIRKSCGEMGTAFVESTFDRSPKKDVYVYCRIIKNQLGETLQSLADERKKKIKMHEIYRQHGASGLIESTEPLPQQTVMVSQIATAQGFQPNQQNQQLSDETRTKEVRRSCYSCGGAGHFQRECPSRPRREHQSLQRGQNHQPNHGNQMNTMPGNPASYSEQACWVHKGHNHKNKDCKAQMNKICPIPGHSNHNQALCNVDINSPKGAYHHPTVGQTNQFQPPSQHMPHHQQPQQYLQEPQQYPQQPHQYLQQPQQYLQQPQQYLQQPQGNLQQPQHYYQQPQQPQQNLQQPEHNPQQQMNTLQQQNGEAQQNHEPKMKGSFEDAMTSFFKALSTSK